jgi:hypothetical protein
MLSSTSAFAFMDKISSLGGGSNAIVISGKVNGYNLSLDNKENLKNELSKVHGLNFAKAKAHFSVNGKEAKSSSCSLSVGAHDVINLYKLDANNLVSLIKGFDANKTISASRNCFGGIKNAKTFEIKVQ